MDFNDPQVWQNILTGIFAATVALALLWVVVRSAVLEALRHHQRDLDKRR